jgi:hypothetical protein
MSFSLGLFSTSLIILFYLSVSSSIIMSFSPLSSYCDPSFYFS